MKPIDIPLLLAIDYLNRCEKPDSIEGQRVREDGSEMAADVSIEPSEALEFYVKQERLSMAYLGQLLQSSSSTIYQSIQRSTTSQLLAQSPRIPTKYAVNRRALIEFLIYGIRYVFPAVQKGVTRGMPTASSAMVFPGNLSSSSELPFVWPGSGATTGIAIEPLHKSVPALSSKSGELYRTFVVIDAIRLGSAREADIAKDFLKEVI